MKIDNKFKSFCGWCFCSAPMMFPGKSHSRGWAWSSNESYGLRVVMKANRNASKS